MRDRAEHLRRRDEEEDAAPVVAERAPAEGPVARIQDMQRGMGNAAVVELLGAQAKLTVGAVHDPAEAEADRVAAAVLRNLDAGAVAPQKEGAARMVRRKAAPSSAAAAPGHGLEGGEALPETSAAIDAARGGGQQMDPGTLTRMESAFGTDLSDVRIHSDGNAAALSRDLNAKAFTTGKDVFFGAGEYDPKSRSGQEVLAHELTHTIQQSGGAEANRISRLSLQNTNWEKANWAKMTAGGGTGGVALVNDGSGMLAIKAGEDMPAEILIATNLMEDTISGEKEEGWTISTPAARVVDNGEAGRIRNVVPPLLDENDPNLPKWLDKLNSGQGYTIVFEGVSGEDFLKIIDKQMDESTKMKSKGLFSKQKEEVVNTKTTAMQMITQPGQLTALGKGSAVDIFMGNGDRLLKVFGPQNWMVDTKTNTIHLIDNVYGGSPEGWFTTAVGKWSITDAFEYWAAQSWVGKLQRRDFDGLGQQVADSIQESCEAKQLGMPKDKNSTIRDNPIVQTARANHDLMASWFASGLQQGYDLMVNALRNPLNLLRGVPEETKPEALASLCARYYFLMGMDAKKAWVAGQRQATKLLAPKEEEKLPEESQEEQPKWVPGRKGGRPRSGGWQSAKPGQLTNT